MSLSDSHTRKGNLFKDEYGPKTLSTVRFNSELINHVFGDRLKEKDKGKKRVRLSGGSGKKSKNNSQASDDDDDDDFDTGEA